MSRFIQANRPMEKRLAAKVVDLAGLATKGSKTVRPAAARRILEVVEGGDALMASGPHLLSAAVRALSRSTRHLDPAAGLFLRMVEEFPASQMARLNAGTRKPASPRPSPGAAAPPRSPKYSDWHTQTQSAASALIIRYKMDGFRTGVLTVLRLLGRRVQQDVMSPAMYSACIAAWHSLQEYDKGRAAFSDFLRHQGAVNPLVMNVAAKCMPFKAASATLTPRPAKDQLRHALLALMESALREQNAALLCSDLLKEAEDNGVAAGPQFWDLYLVARAKGVPQSAPGILPHLQDVLRVRDAKVPRTPSMYRLLVPWARSTAEAEELYGDAMSHHCAGSELHVCMLRVYARFQEAGRAELFLDHLQRQRQEVTPEIAAAFRATQVGMVSSFLLQEDDCQI